MFAFFFVRIFWHHENKSVNFKMELAQVTNFEMPKTHRHVFRRLSSSDAAGLRDGVRSVQSTAGWQ